MDAVLDNQAALVLVFDVAERLVRFNRACEVTTGRDFEDLQGDTGWLDLVPVEERASAVREVIAELGAGAERVQRETHLCDRAGQTRLIAWTHTALRGEQGAVAHVVATGVDITDQRTAEERARVHLEAASLLQRHQTANELATLLAHELNQPLAAIATYAEVCSQLVMRHPLPVAVLRDNVRHISEQAVRAGDTIRHLRTFISRGEIVPVPVDLNAVVRRACELIAPSARSAGVSIRTTPDGTLPPVLGVDVHIEQVLLNLLRNAVDSLRDAGSRQGRIVVETRPRGAMAAVSVRDNGPGLDPATAKRLFEPLASTKDYGLGVGLRISRSLIDAHGGLLWAEPGAQGGSFHFTLPFARPPGSR